MNFLEAENNRWHLGLALLMVLLVFIGFWNFEVLKPVLILGTIGMGIISWKNRKDNNRGYWLDLLMVSLLIVEGVSYLTSIYQPNSFLCFERIFYWVLFYFVLRHGLVTVISRNILLIALAGFAFIVACGALITFFNLKANLQSEGWLDASQFKAFFSPFHFRNNDWATVALTLMPFPLVAIVLFRSSKWIQAMGLASFALVVFGVLISFSRGAYLSLGVFGLVSMVSIFYHRLNITRPMFMMALATGVMILLLMIPIAKPLMTTLAMNKTVSQQRSTAGRLDIFQMGWCKAKAHWLTGAGGYNYALTDDHCLSTEEDAGYSSFANNLYLQILIEKGIFGLLMYGLLFLFVLFQFYKKTIQSSDQNERLINLLLFAGFITYCFREMFFSSFFESEQVMVMVGIYAVVSSQWTVVSGRRLVGSGQWSVDGGRISPVLQPPTTNHLSPIANHQSLIPIIIIIVLAIWFFVKKQKYNKAAQVVIESVEAWNQKNNSLAINKINMALKGAPDIAPYHELAGLISGQVGVGLDTLFSNSTWINPEDKSNTVEAITHFKQALVINPSDAGYHFNLGCLLYFQNQDLNDSIKNHFKRALNIEPNNIEFLIGEGLIYEQTGDSTIAFELYEKAIRLDPEILDSEFYSDFISKNPAKGTLFIDHAIHHLSNRIDTAYNTMYAARLARLFWSRSDYSAAKKLFEQVVLDLPDLYRPYYFLGRIAEMGRDSALALNYYRKAVFLSDRDYLAPLAMGDYYYSRLAGNPKVVNSVIRYYRDAIDNAQQHQTRHRERAGLQYRMGIPVSNDNVLKQITTYTRTRIDFEQIKMRMAEVSKKFGR